MFQRSAGGKLLELSLFTISSLVLYHVGIQAGIGIVLFLIPLQAVASRRGEASLLAACGLFLLVFLALRLLPFLGGRLQPDILTVVETMFVVSLLLGLVVVNFPLLAHLRALYRLLGMTAAAGFAAVPVSLWLSGNLQFQEAVGTLFSEASRMLLSLFAGGSQPADSALSALLSPDALRKMSEALLSRSALAFYFGLLSFSWWAGQASAARSVWPRQERFHFAAFRLESFWLWPLIVALALILVDLFVGARISGVQVTQWAQYTAWNLCLVVVILYGLQGLAIVRFHFEKNGLPRLLWLMLIVVLAALAASPRFGLFIILAISAFGVSENWIRYRLITDKSSHETE